MASCPGPSLAELLVRLGGFEPEISGGPLKPDSKENYMDQATTEQVVEVINKNSSKKKSKWSKGQPRPAAWWTVEKKEHRYLKPENSKEKHDPRIGQTTIFNVKIGSYSIGLTFDQREMMKWFKDSNSPQRMKSFVVANYSLPKGIVNAG